MDLIEVFQHEHTAVSQLVKSVLEDHGLHPILQGEHLASSVGIASFIVPCRVLVPKLEVPEAQAVIAVMEESANLDEKGGPEKCSSCSADWEPGFQECWRCQAPLADQPAP